MLDLGVIGINPKYKDPGGGVGHYCDPGGGGFASKDPGGGGGHIAISKDPGGTGY
ncbi:hypothetical protein [Heyndrickxia oleronia]|uniref:hypothetical protein n=1 Tax=Heyndrickxia oleronia TaxID=38875 RepID=UPI001B272DC2|nr:hypothetical protein [Heyndrickxia oleronia]GIN38471.1 hypothetical protein J19TS1_14200 [Heyndrickxia oleronia]